MPPKLLLLGEPFGMRRSLARRVLQEVLMEVWVRIEVTAVRVTPDLDEASLRANRVVVTINGPQATIDKIRHGSAVPSQILFPSQGNH